MSRSPITRAEAVAALDFSQQIEARADCRAMRLANDPRYLRPGGVRVAYIHSERDLLAPSSVDQRLAATVDEFHKNYSSVVLKVEVYPPSVAPPGHALKHRFKDSQACFVEHAARSRVLLQAEAQQVIYIARTLELVRTSHRQSRILVNQSTGGYWHPGQLEDLTGMVADINMRLALLRASVDAHPHFFGSAPPRINPLIAPEEDWSQWTQLNARLARRINRLNRWVKHVNAEIESLAAEVTARDAEAQIESQLTLMNAPACTANVTPDVIAQLPEGTVLDVSGEPYHLGSPLDQEWRALAALAAQAVEVPTGSARQTAEAEGLQG